MILFIDNYDSYVYNLVQYVSRHRRDLLVIRNDAITPETLFELDVDRVIISPGPCGPLEAGLSLDVWRLLGHRVPILGICLGHQCLGHLFGMSVVRAREVVHGRASPIYHRESRLLDGLSSPFLAGRYHSLVVSGPVHPALKATAWLEDGTLMGLEHRVLPLFGLQFHPESILTPVGREIVARFLSLEPVVPTETTGSVTAPAALEVPGQVGEVVR